MPALEEALLHQMLPSEAMVADIGTERYLGSIQGKPGPTVIMLGGMHGNEAAGVSAIQLVMERIRRDQVPVYGQIHGLVGNLKALKNHLRFLDFDLNRMWRADTELPAGAAELEEKRALELAINKIIATTSGPHILLDLHTTSAEGPPFCLLGDAGNKSGESLIPVPQILGLIDLIPGTLAHHMVQCGHRAFVYEGGQHRVPKTLKRMRHGIWLFLVDIGVLKHDEVPNIHRRIAELAEDCEGLPAFLKVRYRHPVQTSDEFLMKPGFLNFDVVKQGQLLAWDKRGEIRAPFSGRLLMPLYQGQGTDGFFLGEGMH